MPPACDAGAGPGAASASAAATTGRGMTDAQPPLGNRTSPHPAMSKMPTHEAHTHRVRGLLRCSCASLRAVRPHSGQRRPETLPMSYQHREQRLRLVRLSPSLAQIASATNAKNRIAITPAMHHSTCVLASARAARPPMRTPARTHTRSTIFPALPCCITSSCARGASAKGSSSPTTGRSVPARSPASTARIASAHVS